MYYVNINYNKVGTYEKQIINETEDKFRNILDIHLWNLIYGRDDSNRIKEKREIIEKERLLDIDLEGEKKLIYNLY